MVFWKFNWGLGWLILSIIHVWSPPSPSFLLETKQNVSVFCILYAQHLTFSKWWDIRQGQYFLNSCIRWIEITSDKKSESEFYVVFFLTLITTSRDHYHVFIIFCSAAVLVGWHFLHIYAWDYFRELLKFLHLEFLMEIKHLKQGEHDNMQS